MISPGSCPQGGATDSPTGEERGTATLSLGREGPRAGVHGKVGVALLWDNWSRKASWRKWDLSWVSTSWGIGLEEEEGGISDEGNSMRGMADGSSGRGRREV